MHPPVKMQVLSFNDLPLDFLFGGAMFERLEKIIDKDNLNKLKETTIMVVGIGGVGGYVVEALVRSGIGNIIIIDKDKVDITNKNRQIIALDSTIGKSKVEVMKERILDINKECNVVAIEDFLLVENTYEIIKKYMPDYVVDACDTVTTKKEIIRSCVDLDIELVSCMGTGNRFDPSKLEITDLRKTSYDPIAKILRKYIKDEKIKKKINVLYSKEESVKTGDRTPGSTGFVPPSAGLLIASFIFRKIINK